ncbi:MAG TPA: META domain-containing protein [Candidatus Limnocylindria bacterium]|nr:META domain-containing protein [Candidatus Limnocylindria bacterium]
MAIACLLVLTSCARGSAAGNLDGIWVLDSGSRAGKPLPVVPGRQATLQIDGDKASGNSGCNLYGGTMQRHGNDVTFGELAATAMGCEGDAMALESAFLGALTSVTSLVSEGDRLTLRGEGVVLEFSRQPPIDDVALLGTTWTLDTLVSGESAMSTVHGAEPARLSFAADGTFGGSTGCRGFTGTYELTASTVSVLRLAAASPGCEDAIGQQDAQVLDVLGDGFTVAIEGDRLTASGRDGGQLVYTAQP